MGEDSSVLIFFQAEKRAFYDGGGIGKVMTYWVWNELQQGGDLVSTDEP